MLSNGSGCDRNPLLGASMQNGEMHGTRPLACVSYLYGTRRLFLDRFPYFVVFRETAKELQVIAIAHAKRRPGYWKKRV